MNYRLIALLLTLGCSADASDKVEVEDHQVTIEAITLGQGQGTCLADLDRSGRVNNVDMQLCRQSYGMQCRTQSGRFVGVIRVAGVLVEIWVPEHPVQKAGAEAETDNPNGDPP